MFGRLARVVGNLFTVVDDTKPSNRVRLALQECEDRSTPAAFLVNTTDDFNDPIPGDGVAGFVVARTGELLTSLRSAVQEGNALATAGKGNTHQVTFATGNDPLAFFGTIPLTREMDTLTANFTINGGGTARVLIGGGGQKGMFYVAPTTTSSLLNLTLLGGVNRVGGGGQTGYGGAINNLGALTLSAVCVQDCGADYGGAIFNNGFLTINDSQLLGNIAFGPDAPGKNGAPGGHGGAMLCDANTVTVTGSTIEGNTSEARGGAIAIRATGQVVVTDTDITNNTATANGGGVYVSGGNYSMSGGSLVNNTAGGQGGGVFHSGGVTIFDFTTIQANTANDKGGGAFYANGTFRMTDCTLDQNSASSGGGLYQQGGNAFITRVVLSHNSASGWGGAAYIEAGTVRFTTCVFALNTAPAMQGDKIAKKAAATITLDPDCTGIVAADIVTQP